MPSISTYDGVHEVERKLDQAAANHTLSAAMLIEAIGSIDTAGHETIPYSIGMRWILRNPVEFMMAVGYAYPFFCQCVDMDYIDGVLFSEELLRFIPENRRADLVRMILERHTPANNGWVKPCLDAGIPRDELARMVIDKLRAHNAETSRGYWNFLEHDFLRYGAGRVEGNALGAGLYFGEEHTLWSLLTDDQLYEAIVICADKAPGLLFSAGDINSRITLVQKLQLRLSKEQVLQLLELAADNLQSMSDVSLDIFGQLPLVHRTQIATKLDGGSLELVIQLALEMDNAKGRKFCARYAHRFTNGNAADNMRRLWTPLQNILDNCTLADVATVHKADVAIHVQRRLYQRIMDEGFIYAQVEMGSYYNRKAGQHLPQAQVKINGLTYVQDRFQHRYSAKNGEWVIIDPKRGKQLTPKVVSVVFIPAHRYGEYA
jgi:hypothetical protein